MSARPAAARSAVRAATLAAATALTLALAGCATVPAPDTPLVNPDPWENFNRKVYSFNDSIDRAVLKPVAQAYRNVVPKLVRTGIDNVLGNIYDVWSAANHLLQGKVHSGLDMGMRVLTNTIFGLGGLLDPATEMGLVRQSEDFGQTLGRWGVPSGPYVVLPLLGPSTVRDTGGLLVDRQAAPSTLPETREGRYAVTGIEFLNIRANLLSTGDLVDQVALDPYVFIRDAYLARRRDSIYDGAPPDTFSYDTDDSATAPPAGLAPAASAASGAARAGAARAASGADTGARASALPASASSPASAAAPASAAK